MLAGHARGNIRNLTPFVEGHNGAAGAFGTQQSYEMLHFDGLLGEPATSAFAGGVVDIPAAGDQPKKAALVLKRGFNREMRQIVERKKCGVAILFLPGNRTVGADAAQHRSAAGALGDLNAQHLSNDRMAEYFCQDNNRDYGHLVGQ